MKRILLPAIITFSLIFSLHGQNPLTLEAMLTHIDQDSMRRTMTDMQNFTTRYAPLGNKAVAEYVQSRLIAYGVEAEIDSFYLEKTLWFNGDYVSRYMYNVKGTIAGTTNSDSTVIIGAHLDAINLDTETWPPTLTEDDTPGADDNASGVSVFLEMARIIQKLELKPIANICFIAFDAEEIGLHGAEHDASKRVSEGEKIIIMINNDMVSYQPIDEDYKLIIHWYDNAVPAAHKAQELCEAHTTITPVLPMGDDNNMRQASDSWEYADRGINTVFFIEYYFTPHYHSALDICEYSNFDFLQEVGKLNLTLLDFYARFEPVNISGICKKPSLANLKVFPNPATDYVIIDLPSEISSAEFALFDMYGRILLQENISRKAKINLPDLSAGVYLYQVRMAEMQHSGKLVIN